MRRWGVVSVGLALAVSAAVVAPMGAASAGGGNGRSLESYEWTEITADAGWAARAGLQAAQLGSELFVMGGRGAFNPAGATPIYGDVWRSADGGSTWTPAATDAWPAPVYFQAVTKDGAILSVAGAASGGRPAIMTFGGDRERFELPPWENATRVDADVWRYAPPSPR